MTEWHQHVRVALDEGLTPTEIRAISSGDVDRFDASIAAIIDYTERFVTGSVDDATHQRLSTYYTDEIGLASACSQGTISVYLAYLIHCRSTPRLGSSDGGSKICKQICSAPR